MSRKAPNEEELAKILLEIKSRIADLESFIKKTYNNGIYRLSCPPYDIIVLDHSVE